MDRNCNIDPSPPLFAFSVPWPWYRETIFQIIGTTGLMLTLAFGVLAVSWRLQLAQAKRAAEDASRAKSEFLANMSR